jgi:hypothetical protein
VGRTRLASTRRSGVRLVSDFPPQLALPTLASPK